MRTRILFAAAALVAVGTVLGTASAASAVSEVTITSPSPGAIERTSTPVFRGTGQSDATITVYDREGTVLCSARASAGSWSCRSAQPMGDGSTIVTVEQQVWGAVDRATVPIVIDTREVPDGFPLAEIAAGGFLVLLGAGVAVTTALHTRRRGRRPAAEVSEAAS
ncbi:hypothetical protein ACRAWB_08840 [Leifsonia poae]|uniref:hypothetical protein n=1 Tax=Leifsonia poae TaxID=110933 RepID=UPI003D698153